MVSEYAPLKASDRVKTSAPVTMRSVQGKSRPQLATAGARRTVRSSIQLRLIVTKRETIDGIEVPFVMRISSQVSRMPSLTSQMSPTAPDMLRSRISCARGSRTIVV